MFDSIIPSSWQVSSIVLASQILIRSRIIFDRVRVKQRLLIEHHIIHLMWWIPAEICWNPAKYRGLPMDSSIDAADFQHQRILFSPGSTQDQLFLTGINWKRARSGYSKSCSWSHFVRLPKPSELGRDGPLATGSDSDWDINWLKS